jgi:hypothetical protein
MRQAAVGDAWRRAGDVETYPFRLDRVSFSKVKGFGDEFSINFNSAITAICGKNGVGKSSLLKIIYGYLKDNLDHPKVTKHSQFNFSVVVPSDLESGAIEEKIYYLDPSFECARIISYISTTVNFEELLEGLESNNFLNKSKVIKSVSGCIGKPYKSVSIYEIENALEDDYTFPYFIVELVDGTKYNSLSMGMGEHLCMYILWYVEWVEKNSILLIEELENYLSAYSQKKLIDFLASRLSDKKVWSIITTHSEHILSAVGVDNTRVIYRKGSKTSAVSPDSMERYLRALGVNSTKKGVYFVEDYFASVMFKCLVKYFLPDLLDLRDVIGLRCDSNLEKVVRHYQPTPKAFFDLMAVFDADQHAKISGLLSCDTPSICLPSKSKKNPEDELWNALKNNFEQVAEFLAVRIDRLESAIADFELEDHHDRYNLIASEINVNIEQLTGSIFKSWLKTDENEMLAKKFMIALYFREHDFTFDKFSELPGCIRDESIFNDLMARFEDIYNDSSKARIYFDGVKINLACSI